MALLVFRAYRVANVRSLFEGFRRAPPEAFCLALAVSGPKGSFHTHESMVMLVGSYSTPFLGYLLLYITDLGTLKKG